PPRAGPARRHPRHGDRAPARRDAVPGAVRDRTHPPDPDPPRRSRAPAGRRDGLRARPPARWRYAAPGRAAHAARGDAGLHPPGQRGAPGLPCRAARRLPGHPEGPHPVNTPLGDKSVRSALAMIVETIRAGYGQHPLHAQELADSGHDPTFLERAAPVLEFLYARYFRVRTLGIENVPAEG